MSDKADFHAVPVPEPTKGRRVWRSSTPIGHARLRSAVRKLLEAWDVWGQDTFQSDMTATDLVERRIAELRAELEATT